MQNPNASTFHSYSRILHASGEREKYRKRSTLNSVVYWKKKKDILCEIEFLTNYASNGDIIIYAGEVPYINALSKLFQNLYFHIYGTKHSSNLENVITYKALCINHIDQYKGKDVLFISNIKTLNPIGSTPEQVELKNEIDIRLQEKVYYYINPKKALLRFRLPWKINLRWVTGGGRYFEYLQGDIYLQPWGSKHGTETRLLVGKNASRIKYDNIKYEEQMAYFNNKYRPSYFHSNEYDNMDHCYDCVTEIKILKQYLIKKNLYTSKNYNDLRNMINTFLKR